MSRVVVIGATGHAGTYLLPRLVRGGHEVIAISHGTRGPYHASREWASVRRVTADRDAEDERGTFGTRIAALRPDAVIDLICFTAASARQLVDMLRPSRPLLIHCGTIWVHGPALRVPVTEDEPRTVLRRVRHRQGGDRGWAEFERRPAPSTPGAEHARQHTVRSIAASIDRARQVLGYAPQYASLDALHEALAWLAANGQADVGGQEF